MLGGKLLTFITNNYLDGGGLDFEMDTPLLDLNIIDSSSLFDLVEWIRKETGKSIPLQEVKPSNFNSVQAVVDLVQRL
jgi:acyl carrier protein